MDLFESKRQERLEAVSNIYKEEDYVNIQEDCRHNALGYDGIGNV